MLNYFKGDNCEITKKVDPCDTDNNPCQNDGICSGPLDGQASCDCSSIGYSGDNCEINIDDCNNHNCVHYDDCVDGINSIHVYKAGFIGVYDTFNQESYTFI